MQQQVRQVASRFLLPLEMYLGVTAFAWGLAGGAGKGMLHSLLGSARHPYLDDVWLAMLCGMGLAQATAAAVEWLCGRGWGLEAVWRSARVRVVAAFVAGLTWLWVLKLLLEVGPFEVTLGLTIMAPTSALAQLWVFWENYRVRLAADASIPTSTMILKR